MCLIAAASSSQVNASWAANFRPNTKQRNPLKWVQLKRNKSTTNPNTSHPNSYPAEELINIAVSMPHRKEVEINVLENTSVNKRFQESEHISVLIFPVRGKAKSDQASSQQFCWFCNFWITNNSQTYFTVLSSWMNHVPGRHFLRFTYESIVLTSISNLQSVFLQCTSQQLGVGKWRIKTYRWSTSTVKLVPPGM